MQCHRLFGDLIKPKSTSQCRLTIITERIHLKGEIVGIWNAELIRSESNELTIGVHIGVFDLCRQFVWFHSLLKNLTEEWVDISIEKRK